MTAAGLAATPDAAGTITDHDATDLACVFLSKAEQQRLFGRDSCGFWPSAPGAEFALKDGAAAFRSRTLPAIIAAAPRLPLRVLLLVRGRLDHFDDKQLYDLAVFAQLLARAKAAAEGEAAAKAANTAPPLKF
jgi:hypothetical protein